MEEKFYTVRDIMEILKVSKATALAYIHGGLLKARKLKPNSPTSKFLIAESDLKAFINAGEVPRGYYQNLYPRPHKKNG